MHISLKDPSEVHIHLFVTGHTCYERSSYRIKDYRTLETIFHECIKLKLSSSFRLVPFLNLRLCYIDHLMIIALSLYSGSYLQSANTTVHTNTVADYMGRA